MFNKTPSEAIVTKKDGNIKSIKTPYDDNDVLNSPIVSLGNENNKTLSNLLKSFGETINI